MFDSMFPSHWTTLRKLMWLKLKGASAAYETVTGAIVNFTTQRAAPLKSLLVSMSPVQSGSGDPSPDNVRPISGFSTVGVQMTGTNCGDEQWKVGGLSTTDGAATTQSTTMYHPGYIPVPAGKSVYLHIPSGTTAYLFWYSGEDITFYNGNSGEYVSAGSVSVPNDANYLRIQMNASYGTTYNSDISINYPATETAYIPYNTDSRKIFAVLCGDNIYTTTGITNQASGVSVSSPAPTTLVVDGTDSTSQYPATKQLLTNYNLTEGKTYIVSAYANISSGKALFGIRNSSHTLVASSGVSVTTSQWLSCKFTYDPSTNNYLSFFCNNGARHGIVTYENITFAEALTVYGGTLDVVSGVLTVTHILEDMNIDGTWYSASSGANRYYTQTHSNYDVTERDAIVCNVLPTTIISSSTTDVGICLILASGTTPRIAVRLESEYMGSTSDFKAQLHAIETAIGGAIQYAVPLAEPLVFQLTPQEVLALVGENNCWSTGDTVTVEYRKN